MVRVKKKEKHVHVYMYSLTLILLYHGGKSNLTPSVISVELASLPRRLTSDSLDLDMYNTLTWLRAFLLYRS